MTEPTYTSKWRCKECGQLYGHNPSECDICGHTIFRPLPADGASESFEGGEESTELGADVSDLLDRIESKKPAPEDEPIDPKGEEGPEKRPESSSGGGILASILSWLR